MLFLTLVLLLVPVASPFRLPFKLVAVTNVTVAEEQVQQISNYFVANISIGTPPQLFTVIVDTLTADLFVPDLSCDIPKGVCSTDDCTGVFCADLCPDKKCCIQIHDTTNTSSCYGKRQFYSSLSSTYSALKKPYTIVNSYGTTVGFTGKDVVRLGDDPKQTITIPDVSFLQATNVGEAIRQVDADGVLGLAFQSASQTNSVPPFIQAVNQGDVNDSMFSIWLEHQNQTDDLGTFGVIYYGGIDPFHCSTARQSVALSGAGRYQITVANVNTTSGSKSQSTSKNTQTYLDSSNSNIDVPSAIISNIQNVLGLTAGTIFPPVVPCSTKITLGFTFAGGSYQEVTERDLIQMIVPGICKLQVTQSTDNRVHLGIPFFRGRCTFFDVNRHTIAFSPALSQN
ncbi:unnamed protein product [Caenorhabditis auriculariae]|uniref:Peptidase A1 domain-containing protein n=1 Tax=Caenorhabditis auriculariae TaxID=2777116 RepID=A0A8S1GP16_9PELO|nr:unnamed protein product [Caenorhabditis auriculariae]